MLTRETPGEFVHYEVSEGVGVITLDRPPLNTYDDLLHHQLEQAWRRAARDDAARVIVLQASGKHFCAGAEMKEPLPLDPELAAGAMTPPEELAFIRNLMKPTIAAVQGGCIGGGQRFVFPCDLVFCSEDAFFRDPLVTMGIGGIQSPLHAWFYGPRLAKEMLFGATRVPASRLYAMGTVNRLYPRETLHAETLAFAKEVATASPLALRQAKRSVNITTDIMGQHYIMSRFAELLDDAPRLDMTPPG